MGGAEGGALGADGCEKRRAEGGCSLLDAERVGLGGSDGGQMDSTSLVRAWLRRPGDAPRDHASSYRSISIVVGADVFVIRVQYEFEGPTGTTSLLDLFEGRRQLIVYHFMSRDGVGTAERGTPAA